jgi:hypothetical protein
MSRARTDVQKHAVVRGGAREFDNFVIFEVGSLVCVMDIVEYLGVELVVYGGVALCEKRLSLVEPFVV